MTDIYKRIGRPEAAERIRSHGVPCQPSSLAKAATEGSGPPYVLMGGRAYYLPEDCDAYAQSRISLPIRRAADAHRADGEVAA